MNCLKKTPVLNRQCLRHKIEELSPLFQNLSWGPTKDSLFRATWSYYASGCQERLSSIRRRIEQNARIVAPCKFRKDWNPILTRKERKLPPGVDLEDHIYREFVSCFRSAEGPAKVKSAPKHKELKPGDFPTPEQWLLWKREEEQVKQALKKCKDPYLKEELSKKLEELNKLTSRRPLIVLTNQKKEAPKKSVVIKSKRDLKSKESARQPGLTSQTGPYVNRLPKAAVITPEKSKDTGRMALTSFEKDHPSLETIGSTRLSLRKKHQPLKRREILRNSQLDNARLSQTSKTSSKASKKSDNLPNKFSKISYVSQIMEEKAAEKEKNPRRKSKNAEKKRSLPNDSMFLIRIPKTAKKLKEMPKETNPKSGPDQNLDMMQIIPSYQPYKIPEINPREKGREASQSQVRQEIPSHNEDLIITNQVKRKSISGRRRIGSIRRSRSWHMSGTSLLGATIIKTSHKNNRKSISLKDTVTEPVPDFNQISPFDKLLKKSHKIPENNSKGSSNHSSIRSGSSNLPKFKYNGEFIIPNQVKRIYSVSTIRKLQGMGSVRRSRSWQSSGTSILGKKDNRNTVVLQDTNPEPAVKLGDELSEDQSSIFGRVLNAPGYKPYINHENNPSLRSGSSILQQTNYNRDSVVTNQVKRTSKVSTRRRMVKPRSSHSSGASSLGYIPFKANREKRARVPQKEYVPELTFTQPAARSEAESTLSFYHGSRQNLRQVQVNTGSSHGWPLPVNLQRHQKYISPFGQFRNKKEEAKPTKNKGQKEGSKDVEIISNELRRPSVSITPGKAKPQEMVSLSHSKISESDHSHGIEDIQQNRQSHSKEDRPLVIADIVAEFMKSYGSKMSFKDVYPCLLKTNELDSVSPEIPLKEPQVKKDKAEKAKLKEEKTSEKKSLEKMPSKRETEPCFVCNLVRRRQSELRPYMQRMQKQRQRMELKAYYTQKILKKQDTPEDRRPCAQQVLTRCYQALSICRRLLELRRMQKSQDVSPENEANDKLFTG